MTVKLGYYQKHMLDFAMRYVSIDNDIMRRFSYARDRDTKRVAESLAHKGFISLHPIFNQFVLTEAGRVFAYKNL